MYKKEYNQLSSQTRSVCNVFLSFQAGRSTALQHALSDTKLTRPHESAPWTKQTHTKERNRTERIIDFAGSSSMMALQTQGAVSWMKPGVSAPMAHEIHNADYTARVKVLMKFKTYHMAPSMKSLQKQSRPSWVKSRWVCYSRITWNEQTQCTCFDLARDCKERCFYQTTSL